MKKQLFILASLFFITAGISSAYSQEADFTDELKVSEEDFIKSFAETKKAMEDNPTLLDEFEELVK